MRKHLILWADDDPDDRALFRQIVEQVDQHARLVTVNDGRDVLSCMNLMREDKTFPCLVIVDMNMPALGGRETITRIKGDGDFSGVPVVAFSTSSLSADRTFCDRFGVQFFTKPPSVAELKSTIQKMLGLCSCQQQADEGA